MRRAHLVIAGTIAGTAAVLAFPVEASHPGVVGAGTPTSGTGATPASTTPSTSPPATTAPPPSTTSGVASATGAAEQFRYGQLAVTVTVHDNKVTDVTMASLDEPDPRSASIDRYAIPRLEQQAISADSANIDGVSGATFTSEAFAQSLRSALAQLGFK
ncbi:MAG TPA: FMN-binding protein [Acidimicrobiales bacterium]|nr:FMN-binding protein [Acidimicrobiales bacterium]